MFVCFILYKTQTSEICKAFLFVNYKIQALCLFINMHNSGMIHQYYK